MRARQTELDNCDDTSSPVERPCCQAVSREVKVRAVIVTECVTSLCSAYQFLLAMMEGDTQVKCEVVVMLITLQ